MSKLEKWLLASLIISAALIPAAKTSTQGIVACVYCLVCGILFVFEEQIDGK